MKKILTIILLVLSVSTYAQKQYQLGTETVFVPGQTVSNIKLVTYDNKPMGEMITHTFFDSKRAVFSNITSYDNTPNIIILQIIAKDAAKGLVPDIEVKKAYVNPDQKTNPKSYWEVSVGFRKANDDVAEVGSTEYYKNEDGTAIINKYLGTSYIVPFATKAAADAFVTSLKNFIK
ncbi:MAG: hypothetical protein KA319_00920 [Ferruginibacter sp.]|nr:hypothetical protein [Ferruginibacter sp.]